MIPRYYVRIGNDVRGPVDEGTVAAWIAQGMRNAQVCPEGGQVYVPMEQTPLARFMGTPPAAGKPIFVKAAGIGTVVVVAGFSIGGNLLRAANHEMAAEKKEMTLALPTPGASGVLHSGKPITLCAVPKHSGWGWPCRSGGRTVAEGAPVQLMKAEVSAMEGVCRYWVTGGPDQGAAGDAPCALFVAR